MSRTEGQPEQSREELWSGEMAHGGQAPLAPWPASHTQAGVSLWKLPGNPRGRVGINVTRLQLCGMENKAVSLVLLTCGTEPQTRSVCTSPGVGRPPLDMAGDGGAWKPRLLCWGGLAGGDLGSRLCRFGWGKRLPSGQTDDALWRPGICHCHIYNRILVYLESDCALCITSVPHILKIRPQNTFQGIRRKLSCLKMNQQNKSLCF